MSHSLEFTLLNGTATERRRCLTRIGDDPDDATIRLVASQLGADDPAVCEAAVQTLVRTGSARAAAAAAEHLDAPTPAERGYALEVLTLLGAPALASLERLAISADVDLRKYAVDALGRQQLPVGTQLLMECLSDADANVAAAAAEALAYARMPEVAEALGDAALEHDVWVAAAAVHTLAALGIPAAREILEAVLEARPDPLILAAASPALTTRPAGRA